MVLGLSLLFCFGASAQPSILLTDTNVQEGEEFEVVLSIKDVTDISKIRLTLTWDTTYLEFNSTKDIISNGVDIPGLKKENFIPREEGFIGMDWDIEALQGFPDKSITLPGNDWYWVFKASFIAKKAGPTALSIGDMPIPFIIERFQGNNYTAIQSRDFIDGGNITILPSSSDMVSPPPPSVSAEDMTFSITPDKEIACIGDRVCYSLAVENFDSLLTFQFPLSWDQTVLAYDQAEKINLENFRDSDISETQSGESLRIIYTGDLSNPIFLENGITIPDGTSIVDLCFNVIGKNDSQQSIFPGPESTDQFGTEAVNKNEEALVVNFSASPIQTFDCDQTIILNTACNNGPQGGQVCVDIQPVIFQNVGDLFFTLEWDQTALDFATIDPHSELASLEGNIDPATGNLNIEWSAEIGETVGVTLRENDLPVATVCFDIKSAANVGSLIELSYSNEFLSDIDATSYAEIILNGCSIEVMEPILPEPILSAASDLTVVEGQEICVEVLVENFTGITAFEFPVLWDKDVLEFKNIEAEAFLGINVDNATASDGKIFINWGSATSPPESLPGKAVLLSVCFTAKEGINSGIVFSETGSDQSFSIGNTQLESSTENGLVTILEGADNPVTFSTEPMDNLARNMPVCVPVSVKDFSDIFIATILVKWDSTVLQLDSLSNIQLPNFNPINLNTRTPGQLSLIWFDADDESVSLNDGDIIFDLCFTTIGAIGARTDISFPPSIDGLLAGNEVLAELINDPTTGTHIGIVDEGSEIRITTFGIESFNLEEPTCDTDGRLNAIIAGGQDSYTYFWTLNEIAEPQQASDAPFLNRILSAQVDSVCLTVFSFTLDQNDTKCTPVTIDDTRVPMALASSTGLDTLDVGCVNPDLHETDLLGDFQESPDANSGVVRGVWTAINGGSIQPFSEEGFGATAVGLGTYIFTLTNANDCSDSDTLEIVNSAAPTLTITTDSDNITCNTSQVMLSASVEGDEGNEWEYNWTNSDGDTLTGIDPFQLVVEEGGRYSFSISNTGNDCNASEPIIISENIPVVNADAGPVFRELRCEDNFITLDGRDSDTGGNFTTEWTSDKDIIRPLSLTPDVTKVGTYVLKITDNTTGCFDMDTVQVIADPELPVAKAREEAFIGCNQTGTVLRSINDGLDATSVGAKFEYTWTTIDGFTLSEEDTAMVRSIGEYLFIVVNTENDACVADTARVQVVEDQTLPEFNIPGGQTIACSADCIELQVETNDTGSDFTFGWTTDVGNICSGINSLNAQVDEVGTYFLVVTNTANNCSDTSSVNIFPDPENGVFPEAGPTKELTCQQDTVLLDGGASSSSTGNDILYEWRFEEEETVLTMEAALMATKPGRYRLTVIDEAAGCRGSGSVEVTENKDLPQADAGSDFPLEGCAVEAFQLNALNSDSGDGIIYQWTSSDGEIISDETTLTPTVSQPGTYTLVVTNEISGCTDTDETVVSTTVFSPAAIIEETERSLDCNENTIILDATNSITEDGTNSATIEWTTQDGNIISGADTKSLVVDSAGTYILTLTSDNGCEDKATVVVMNTARLPEVDAGEDFRIVCNEQATIDASNSSSGENLVIQWTTNDGAIISGENTLMPEINLGGTYTLVITDTTNNCRVEDVILIESDAILPVAQAGENIEVCGRDAALSASPIAEGITGIWTALNGGQVETNDPLTNVANLSGGENQFIWTLSSEECPDFSADTVMINALTLPVAVADDFEYLVGEGTVELDLVGNDQPNTDNFTINILRDPTTSILNKVSEGVYSLDLPSRPIRQDFQYEICSATCSDVCADAVVRLVVRPETLDSLQLNPNAITPNGDGLNDLLIFDELFIEDFAQSELVIFNRWGDIVYKVSPYNNDWNGIANDGTSITEGTYYYILRLDISEGEIIRGNVTILR